MQLHPTSVMATAALTGALLMPLAAVGAVDSGSAAQPAAAVVAVHVAVSSQHTTPDWPIEWIQHTCDVRRGDRLWCWGRNNWGQVGDRTNDDRFTPEQIGTAHSWVSVAEGAGHSCAVRTSGALYCWGKDGDGQLGVGVMKTEIRHPVKVKQPVVTWTSVVTGGEHTCAIDSTGSLWCWGDNERGQLGIGSQMNQALPVQVGSSTWRSVSAGWDHTCAVRTDRTLWCWGDDEVGALGQGRDGDYQTSPVQVAPSTSWSHVTAGNDDTCGLMKNKSLWCWGENDYGELGIGSLFNQESPVQVGSGTWSSVRAASFHTCGTMADGTLWCWGDNVDGDLGIGDQTKTEVKVPTQVGTLAGWRGLVLGYLHSCAHRARGHMWCWGNDTYGQTGTGGSSYVPVRVRFVM